MVDDWPALEAAITEACKIRGDSDAHRDACLADCAALPADERQWHTDYFNGETSRVKAARCSA